MRARNGYTIHDDMMRIKKDIWPSRVNLGHSDVPPALLAEASPVFFVTVCAKNRTGNPLLPNASAILESIRLRHQNRTWFVHLALVMPDHVHLLVSFPPSVRMDREIGHWKRWLAVSHGISWQRNFFDHRIRNDTEFAEKWQYILMNPVNKSLVEAHGNWPHRIAFSPANGQEIPLPAPEKPLVFGRR